MNNEVNVEPLLAAVKARKEEAKLYRDDGDYDEAVSVLEDAVQLLEKFALDEDSSQEASAVEKTIAWNFADCFGMLGGNYRRLNRLNDAQKSFDRGRRYEENPRFNVSSSYNLVNAITLPIEMKMKTAEEQKHTLEQAASVLERQVRGERRIDRWAWADLGQCLLLLGKIKEADEAYGRFVKLGDSGSVSSHLTVLRRMHDALAGRDEAAAAVFKGIQLLEPHGSS